MKLSRILGGPVGLARRFRRRRDPLGHALRSDLERGGLLDCLHALGNLRQIAVDPAKRRIVVGNLDALFLDGDML